MYLHGGRHGPVKSYSITAQDVRFFFLIFPFNFCFDVYLIGNGTGMYNINLLLYINDQFALTIDD